MAEESEADKEIYIVTSGTYSDYSIRSVHTKKEEAQEVANALGYAADVETWPLDRVDLLARLRSGKKLWHVVMWLNGDTKDVWEASKLDPAQDFCREVVYAPYIVGENRNALRGDVEAIDREGAVKIMNERRIAWLLEHPQTNKSS